MKKDIDLKEYGTKDLQERLQASQAEYAKMKLDHAVSPLENTSKLKKARREIARMHTDLRRREINEQN